MIIKDQTYSNELPMFDEDNMPGNTQINSD